MGLLALWDLWQLVGNHALSIVSSGGVVVVMVCDIVVVGVASEGGVVCLL